MNRNKNTANQSSKKGNKNNYYKQHKGSKSSSKSKDFSLDKEEKYFQKKTGNPASLYFTDANLAEQNSSVSNRTILDTSRAVNGTNLYWPNVIAYAMNPSLGVSPWDEANHVARNSAVQQAASKLLTMIIANTGRVQNYTKWDLIVLIAQIGELVSMTEFGRMALGLVYKYQEINRDLPREFVEACGFDYDDLVANYDNYISEFNAYINISNQVVIPMDKIPYLRKCRDMYQKVYKDSDDEGIVNYHIMVPYSTWILDENSTFGTILRTINVTGFHDDPVNGINGLIVEPANAIASTTNIDDSVGRRQPHTIWTFGEFLDRIYKPMVNALINSATFNLIYSDLRSTKFQSAYSFDFWKPECVLHDYMTPVEYDATMLNIFHNLTVVGAPSSPNLVTYNDSLGIAHPAFTMYNDAMHDPAYDQIVYNPTILLGCADLGAWNAAAETAGFHSVSMLPAENFGLILDFKTLNPSLDERVDAMAYMATQVLNPDGSSSGWTSFYKRFGNTNYILPDHYCVQRYTYIKGSINSRFYRSTDATPAPYDKQFNNGWLTVSNSNGAGSTGMAAQSTFYPVKYWDDVTSSLASLSVNWANYSSGKGDYRRLAGTFVSAINGVTVAQYLTQIADTIVASHSYSMGRCFTNCDVDNWYVLPQIKLINMFNHAYQTLFTPDGIMK